MSVRNSVPPSSKQTRFEDPPSDDRAQDSQGSRTARQRQETPAPGQLAVHSKAFPSGIGRTFWYTLSGRSRLEYPPVHLLSTAAPHHLFIYDNLDADETTAWIFTHDGEWEEVNDGFVHPESRDRVLRIRSVNGEPNWITHQSFSAHLHRAVSDTVADGVAGTTVFFGTLDLIALPIIVSAIEHPIQHS
ncbi:hypothetical protein K488DRAFT_90031 [Vararia minispora EC-137]|uniref:Uncharacterized protein n=1 Tax=Vararia minispora EC-137 TaxID=1314806 RepID=A0ACB8Q923_9AGAM|nr:hypothetical protein K488DRAFT_90031 [Vararia minispora EC-137]